MNDFLIAQAPDVGYAAIGVLIVFVMLAGAAMLLATHLIPKRKRHGPRKDDTYESGMAVVGDARRRFNVRFYLVAMLFLLFDVELVFFYPWVVTFFDAKAAGDAALATFLFVEMAIFFALLALGLIYDLGKGVVDFD